MSFKDSDNDSRVLGLQEQVKSLSDELMQCQADKEFVWSLWKRLQVANPDLTQAVSLVVEREKHKAEIKDRKVLEILQIKDHRIQELEQRMKQQQEEINSFLQKKMAVSEDSSTMQDLTALRVQLAEKDHQLMECRKKEEDERQALQAVRKEIEGLTSRCATLQADLGENERQAKSQRDHKDSAQLKVKELEEELRKAGVELFNLQRYSSSLEGQLSSKEKEVATAERRLTQLGHEFAEVQKLYKQSTEHAAEQSQLIRQLEGLNLDTQRVLRNTEEAHTADTTSYQKLYTELSQCYQSLISSEASLRQRHQELGVQLAERDQHILQLQAQLQQTQQEQKEQPVQETTRCSSRNRQTNLKGAPVQRSRSLSPASSAELDSGRKKEAAQRIQDLEELLQLKTVENEELRRAHDKRRERLCLIHSNYKVVRDQIKELEKSSGRPGGRTQRAEPWQLRQENSDAVWNELAYLKNLTRKLSIEKTVLEEQMDILRVQAAMDRATVKELRTFLHDEHQELVHNVLEEPQVRMSTPKKLSVSSEQMEPTFKKIQQMEWRIMSINRETERLREEKEHLLEDNKELAHNCRKLQASLDSLRSKEAVCGKEMVQAKALAEQEQHCKEIMALESQLIASRKDVTKLHKQLLKLRQDLGILRAARDFYRHRKVGPSQPDGIVSNISTKVKFKTTRLRGPRHNRSHRAVSPNQVINWQGRSPSPTKDEWEDMSVESDIGEEFSDSLNTVSSERPLQRRRAERKFYRCSVNSEVPRESYRNKRNILARDDKQHEPWEQGTREERRRCRSRRKLTKTRCCSSSTSLQQRVESLQRHVYILQSARKDALLSAKELQTVNEKMSAQLSSLTEKLSGSKQVIQKLTSDLAGVVQQKKVLEMELEQWRQSTFPQQPAPPAPPPAVPVNTECSCQGRTKSPPTDSALQALEAEVKQLQTKLKNASAEVTKQVAANKALRGQVQEKDDALHQLQDKLSHVERDVNMKRQLVEDLKTRLKFLQEMEKSYRGQLEDLEKKVKTLSEEATNRKALIDSLKRRLNVATTEKKQREASCTKLTEDLEKKDQQIRSLQARIGSSEQALEALEQTATKQMEGLTQKSSNALDRLQRQLGIAYSQLEQLHSFIKDLASEILLDVKEVKQQLMKRRRLMQTNTGAVKGNLSAKSMIKAKSIAASILNMSENDLADMLDTDQGAEVRTVSPADQEWMDQLKHILQQKIPSASQLMETVHVKMKERKVLTEELAMLTTPVSEKA